MKHADDHRTDTSQAPPHKRSAWGVAWAMLGLIGAFYLLREHWSHVAGTWPYLLLLVCPLMHLFHRHGGHGRHAGHESRTGQE
ncbi:MAG: DUF2933 domain-containing protein [Inhella sp.]|jgi:hypothetical protein|uniref:DUF2933 domain-containing protein n=1 Tax=Inhella sp. TaxID=1921806 RepID=UPI0022C5CAC6|nr:DUF2933 domain-containing protein [Polaromonas sp.]